MGFIWVQTMRIISRNKASALQKLALSFKFTHRCRWWNRKSPTWSNVSTCQVRAEKFCANFAGHNMVSPIHLCKLAVVVRCGAAFNDIRIPQCVRSRRTWYLCHSLCLCATFNWVDRCDYDLVTFPHLCTHPLSLPLSLSPKNAFHFVFAVHSTCLPIHWPYLASLINTVIHSMPLCFVADVRSH